MDLDQATPAWYTGIYIPPVFWKITCIAGLLQYYLQYWCYRFDIFLENTIWYSIWSRSLIRVKRHLRKAEYEYINQNIFEGIKNNNTKPFWKYIKSKRQDAGGIAPLNFLIVFWIYPRDLVLYLLFRFDLIQGVFRSFVISSHLAFLYT
jgi:hypothetical protein